MNKRTRTYLRAIPFDVMKWRKPIRDFITEKAAQFMLNQDAEIIARALMDPRSGWYDIGDRYELYLFQPGADYTFRYPGDCPPSLMTVTKEFIKQAAI